MIDIMAVINDLFWHETDPGTQFTGSFNPTYIDYLAGKTKPMVQPEPTRNRSVSDTYAKIMQIMEHEFCDITNLLPM
jgi:hypothetical protein